MSDRPYSQSLYSDVGPDTEESLAQVSLRAEAERCRHCAVAFEGKPEKVLLLRLACEFDRLSAQSSERRGRQMRTVEGSF